MAATRPSRSLRLATTLIRPTARPPALCQQSICQKRWSSVSQRPGSEYVHFPGAVKSKFTTDLTFHNPAEQDAMPTYRILDQEGAIVDKSRDPPDITDDELRRLYKDMVTVSILDVLMFDAQRQGRIPFYIVSSGEEGIAVGSAAALHADDPIFCQYRETGIFQYRGFTPDDFMAQLFCTKDDKGLGRNITGHYGSREHRIHTISSPLATQIPQASGAAYAVKLQALQNPTEAKRVVACYFGEGAASEGDFHAALNIAATRACPVVFICRNNGYAISTPVLDQYRGDGIASRGVGYGIDTVRVDGNDVLAVREATRRARALALTGAGRPVLLEAMSYRVSHHSTSDDSFAYRARVEVEEWRRRDNPITRLRKYMEARGVWDEAQEKAHRGDARRRLLAAYRAAEAAKQPALINVIDGVYEELTAEQAEQVERLRAVIERYPDEYDVSRFEGGLESLKTRKKA